MRPRFARLLSSVILAGGRRPWPPYLCCPKESIKEILNFKKYFYKKIIYYYYINNFGRDSMKMKKCTKPRPLPLPPRIEAPAAPNPEPPPLPVPRIGGGCLTRCTPSIPPLIDPKPVLNVYVSKNKSYKINV